MNFKTKIILVVITITMIGFFGCENEVAKIESESDEVLYSQTVDLYDNLSELSDYIETKNDASNGDLFDYMTNNPDYTVEDLETLGYIDAEYVTELVDVIKLDVNASTEEEVLEVMGQIDNEPSFGICIICCTGCLNGVPRDHCWTSIAWQWGPGC